MIRNMRILFFLFWCCTLCAAPKAIIFDFGSVITTVDRESVISYIHDTLKTNARGDFKGDALFSAVEEDQTYWEKYAASHGKTLPPGWMETLHQKVQKMVKPVRGMAELVAQLKAQGYRTALLSNTTKIRSDFFRKEGFYKPFDPIILSWEVGEKKPSQQIYQYALKKLNLRAEECIFIDDREENILAARKLGFHAIQFKSARQLKTELSKLLRLKAEDELPDARIGSLED